MLRAKFARSFSTSAKTCSSVPMSRFDPENPVNYAGNRKNIEIAQARLNRPLTFSEKVSSRVLSFTFFLLKQIFSEFYLKKNLVGCLWPFGRSRRGRHSPWRVVPQLATGPRGDARRDGANGDVAIHLVGHAAC